MSNVCIVSRAAAQLRKCVIAAATLAMALAAPVGARAADIPADVRIDLSSIVVSRDELVCLALNDYWEARSESIAGRIAVARVVLNRTMDPRFPSNICDVVKQVSFQGEHKRCQFSWFCDEKMDTPAELDQWRQSLKIASAVLQADCAIPDPTGGALWYHADFTRPAWAVGYESTTIIGQHVFYRDADGSRGKIQPPRKPFIYRLNAFAESVARKNAKGPTLASAAPLGEVSSIAIQRGPAPSQPLAR